MKNDADTLYFSETKTSIRCETGRRTYLILMMPQETDFEKGEDTLF